ncbi:MAG: hypothetical protein ACJA2S_001528 [Cyclobacteriaceae bacterium]|jgi:hypothetical protein
MKITFQNGIVLSSIFGMMFQFIPQLKPVGLLILFLILPVLLVIVLLTSRKESVMIKNRLSSVFLLTITTTTVAIIIYSLLRTLHLPGGSEMATISSVLSIISLIVGSFYIYNNSKVIGAEIALMLIPALMMIWHIIPVNTPPQLKSKYPELIGSLYLNQEANSNALVKKIGECKASEEVGLLIEALINRTGGLDESGRMLGFYDTYRSQELIPDILTTLEKYDLANKNRDMLMVVTYSGEVVLLLSQIRNEVILKNCL